MLLHFIVLDGLRVFLCIRAKLPNEIAPNCQIVIVFC